MMWDRGQFYEQNMFFFWDATTKMALKLSIIGVDPYIIPYLKASIYSAML